MDYLAFRYTTVKYKLPIEFNGKIKRVNPEVVERKLKCEGDAVFLSGGLDSSLITAINRPKMAYTASFEGGFDGDESFWAQKVASHLEIPLTIVTIKRNRYLSTVEHLINLKGDGLHPNEPCLYLLALQAYEDGYRTMLSGEGADGLFGGYTKLLTNEEKIMRDEKSFRARYLQIDTGCKIPFKKWKEWGIYRFMIEVHTPALIERANNACWSAGMDVVFPYLCNDIPQMMWEAPKEQKFDKVILKEIARKYLPSDVINREKVGFPTPWDVKKFLQLNKEIGW